MANYTKPAFDWLRTVPMIFCGLAIALPASQALAQGFWWEPEYQALNGKISSSPGSTLESKYKTGPRGSREVQLSIRKVAGAIILKMELPREAVKSVDPRTGRTVTSPVAPVITIRDNNLDGMPDDFKMEPSGRPLYREEISADGFVKYRNSPEHQIIMVNWSIGIGFSINHFLHGVDSAIPR